MGDPATCLATDQRGMPRSSPCDLGAFELTNTGAATTISLISAPNPVAYGAPVTFTATVTSTVGTPTGAVQFNADGVPLGSPVTLSSGSASTGTSSLGIGVHSIAATYTGDASHNLSSTQINQTVSCTSAMIVTNANDNGVGSLRDALAPVCAGGTITFNDNYTITLLSTLEINKGVTISGAGHRVILDGHHGLRVLKITAGNVTLDHLTIANGQAPLECGPWTAHCGGGLWIQSSYVVVQNCTFYGNSADQGGGIYNYEETSTLTVRNSTFSGNSASYGGGIYSSYSNLNVTNSTFSGNSASADASGAIRNIGDLNMSNSILWGNSGGGLAGYIWSGGVSYSDVQGGWAGTGNIDANPVLASLGDYGGDTQTRALSYRSPAIDAGDPASCLATDQRGEARNDYRCDMGVFELKYADSSTVELSIPGTGTYTFGPTMVKVVVNDTGGCLSGLTVQRYNTNHLKATVPLADRPLVAHHGPRLRQRLQRRLDPADRLHAG